MSNPARFSVEEIQRAIAARMIAPVRGSANLPVPRQAGSPRTGSNEFVGVSMDSRTLRPGELFVAILGRRFDGHAFVAQALAQGAAGVVVERWPLPGIGGETTGAVWKVDDTWAAWGALARFHRERFRIDLAAITGSNGKSTVKTMLAHLLSGSREVLSTPGTQNNRIGVPLTLLRLEEKHRAAVLELGTNRWGEIQTLTEICRPTVGVVTHIGPAHLETFGDLQGVLREKGGLWEAMDSGSPLVLNADDALLSRAGRLLPHPIVWYGTGSGAQVRGSDFSCGEQENRCRVNGRWDLRIPLAGRHNLMNALAALACARVLGLDLGQAAQRLSNVPALPGRLTVTERDGFWMIDDTYNANPASLQAALQVLREAGCFGRRIAVLGDMLELGPRAEELHAEAGRQAVQAGVNLVVTVGPMARGLLEAAWAAGLERSGGRAFSSPEEAGEFLSEEVRPGDVVLVKGSRGMRMERVIACFTTSSIL